MACDDFQDTGYEADDLVRAYCGRCGQHILAHARATAASNRSNSTMVRVYGGIDPGMSGGMALVDEMGVAVHVCKMPDTEREILEELKLWRACGKPVVVVLEKVHAMPKQGVSSTFKFGTGYGGLRMALVASEMAFDEVIPRRWQAAMGCLTKGDKNVSKRRAQELFPSTKVTHALADALLLAEYCRRQHGVSEFGERRRSIREA